MNHIITQTIADVFRRPADANYGSMRSLLDVAEEEKNQSRVIKVNGSDVSFSAQDGQFHIDVEGQDSLPLTNYSMTQVAGMAKIQTVILERLHKAGRDDLVVDNLKTLFPNRRAETKFILIRDHYDGLGGINSVSRAVNGSAYSRLWDYEVFAEMEDFLMTRGFTPMLPDIQSDGMRCGLMHGLNTGLFRGDQCSFGFFFATDELEGNSENLGGLTPGMMVWNSEVGARSFGFHTFYYHAASGSIIIWTPANHKRKRFVHRGNIKKAFKEYVATLEDVADNFQTHYTDDLKTFETASVIPFAEDDGTAIQRLHKIFNMSVVNAKAAVRAARLRQNSYGLPLSVWNIALGIAWEAGQTGRAESLVDDTLVATKMMRVLLKV
jgi:hypothetical protein